MNRLRLLMLLVLIPFLRVGAEEAAGRTLTLEQAVGLIIANNPDIRAAAEAVRIAERDLGSVFALDSSRLTLKGGYTDTGSTAGTQIPDSGRGVTGSAALSVPVLPLVTFSGNITTEGSGDVSVTVKPFEKASISPVATETLKKARARLESLVRETRVNAENVLLASLSKAVELSNARKAAELQKESLEVKRKLYDMGELSLGDLQEASALYSTAVQKHFSAQKADLETGRTLLLLLGPTVPPSRIETVSLESILTLIERRSNEVTGKTGAAPASLEQKLASYKLESLQDRLSATPLWTPDLSLGGKFGIPGGKLELSATFSFSPSDLRKDEREDLSLELARTRNDLATENYLIEIDRDLSLQSLEISARSLESARSSRAQTGAVLEETRVLYGQGERTVLELKKAELDVLEADSMVFQQAVNLLRAQNDYLLMFPE